MSEVAVAYVSIVPKFGSGFKSAIAGEMTGAGGAGGKQAGTSFKDTFLGVVAGNLMTSAIKGVGNTLRSAFDGGFNRLKNIEQAETKLLSVGQSAGLTGKALDDFIGGAMGSVSAAVDGTRFALSDAADMAAVLASAGVKAGADMERWLNLTANAAEFNNVEFADMQRVLQTVAQEGRVTGETLNQLPIGVSALAQHLGVSQAEVRKLASEGKISAEDFAEALEGTLGNAAKNAGGNFSSLAANIKTAMNATMANLIEPFYNAAKPIMAALLPLVKMVRDQAKVIGENFGAWLQPKAEAFATKLGELPALFTAIGQVGSTIIERVGTAFGGVSERAGGLREVLAGLVERIRPAFDGLLAAVQGFVDGFGGFDGLVQSVSAVLPLLLGPLGLVKSALLETFSSGGGIDFAAFGATVASVVQPLMQLLGELASVITGALAQGFQLLLPVVLDVGARLLTLAATLAQQLLPVLLRLVQAALPVITQLIAGLAPVIFQVIGALAPLVMQLLEMLIPAFMSLISAVLPPLMSILGTLVPAIIQVVQAVIPLVTALVEMLAPIIVTIVGQILPPLLGVLLELVDLVLAVVVPAIAAFVSMLAAVLVPAVQALTPIIQTVFSFIATTIGNVMQAIQGIIRVVTGAIKGDWSQVWSGIKTFFGAVWNQIKAIGQTAVNAVKSVIQAGLTAAKAIAEGIFNGLVSFVSGIPSRLLGALAALSSLAGKAAQWFGAILQSAKDKFGQAVDFARGIPGKIVGALGNLGSRLTSSGRSLISGFVNGIKQGFTKAVSAVKDGLAKVRNFFPFSPAKEGPFSGRGYVTYSADALTSDFAKHIEQGTAKIRAAASGASEAATLTGKFSPQAVELPAGSSQVVQHNTIHLPEWVRSFDDIVRVLSSPGLAAHAI